MEYAIYLVSNYVSHLNGLKDSLQQLEETGSYRRSLLQMIAAKMLIPEPQTFFLFLQLSVFYKP